MVLNILKIRLQMSHIGADVNDFDNVNDFDDVNVVVANGALILCFCIGCDFLYFL